MTVSIYGFKTQIGAFVGVAGGDVRKPDEGTFQAVLPSGLPMRFALEVYSLTVQDAHHVHIASQDTGVDYPAGSIAAQFKDEDVAFQDTSDTVWHTKVSGGTNGSVTATGHALAADVGTATLSGVAAYTATGHQADANVGTSVARGAGSVSATGHQLDANVGTAAGRGAANAVVTGHELAANVGTAAGAGAASIAATGHQLDADAGSAGAAGETVEALDVQDAYHENVADTPDLTQSGDITVNATGHAIAADVGTAVLSGTAQTATTGDELTANVGTPNIGGAGKAVPFGDVLAADIGTATLSGSAAFAVSGHELAADVGTAVASAQTFVYPEDAANENVADSPLLVLTNGDAFPAGVDSDASVGTATATGAGVVAPVVPRGRRRPVAWQYPVAEVEQPEPVIDAEAFPRGLRARASVGMVVVKAGASVLPFADFSRSRVGVVVAAVDYTLRDQQEEEFIQLLLAA